MTYEWAEIPRNSCLWVYFSGAWLPKLQALDMWSTKGTWNSHWPAWITKQCLAHGSNLVPPSQHPAPPSPCLQPVRVPLGKEAHLVSKRKAEFSSVTQGFYSCQPLSSSDGRACSGKKKAWLAQTSPLWFDNLFWRVNHIWYKSTLHPFPALLDWDIPPFNQLIYVFRQVCEGFLHINGISGWCFNVLHAVGSSQFLCFMASHLPLCIQVTLVTHQNKYNLVGLNVYFGLF